MGDDCVGGASTNHGRMLAGGRVRVLNGAPGLIHSPADACWQVGVSGSCIGAPGLIHSPADACWQVGVSGSCIGAPGLIHSPAGACWQVGVSGSALGLLGSFTPLRAHAGRWACQGPALGLLGSFTPLWAHAGRWAWWVSAWGARCRCWRPSTPRWTPLSASMARRSATRSCRMCANSFPAPPRAAVANPHSWCPLPCAHNDAECAGKGRAVRISMCLNEAGTYSGRLSSAR